MHVILIALSIYTMFGLFQEAIDWLLSHNFVLPGGVGTIGVSTGGELSLLLAAYFPEKVHEFKYHHQNVLSVDYFSFNHLLGCT